MIAHWAGRAASRSRDLRRRFATDRRGVAAVEFALVLPLMLVLYVCTSALTLAVAAKRDVGVLARTLTDVTAQQGSAALTDTTAQSIFNASTSIMAPYATTALKMTLSNVEFVADPLALASNLYDAKTRWTVTFTNGTLRPCSSPLLTPVPNGTTASPSTMPVGLYAGGFVIVADVSYVYTPTFGYFNYNFQTGKASSSGLSFTIAQTEYMRPRQTSNIHYTSGQTAQICPITSPQQA